MLVLILAWGVVGLVYTGDSDEMMAHLIAKHDLLAPAWTGEIEMTEAAILG